MTLNDISNVIKVVELHTKLLMAVM